MLVKVQRYQKTRNISGAARLPAVGVWLALSGGLMGCASAEAPQAAPTQALVAAPDTATAAAHLAPGALPSATASGQLSPAPVRTTPVRTAPASTAPASTAPVSSVPPAVAEQALVDAREAMRKKQWTQLDQLVPTASATPLIGSYAQYWALRQRVANPTLPVPEAELQQFMATNQDDYLADRIKADWIVAAARAGDYTTVNQLGPVVSSNASVDCSRLMARHMTGQRVTQQEAMAAFSPVSACWSMLDQLENDKVVGWEALQGQLRAMLETTKTGDAQRMAALMFDGAQMRSYAALMKNPRQWLSTQKAPATREQTELITLALSRLAREKDRANAEAYIENNWATSIPKQDIQWVWGQFGLISALNVEPEAVRWYRRSGTAPMTDYNHAWQVRSELRQTPINWKQVENAIVKMGAQQQAEPVWVYWRGRAIAAQGDQKTAGKYYASLRNELNFYGQLAVEELGEQITLPPAPPPITKAEFAMAQANPGLQRAIKLFRMGWRPEAVPEWNFALRGMNDRQLRAAAELARHEQIYDRVVNTSLRTNDEIDFSQRFVAPFEGRVSAKAREINLDPAWVYGLIRQESRFITDARSHVGASGLMQLMPATARWVAKKIGMTNFTPSSVNDFDTNTILGTNYLGMVLGQLNGSQLLATAGYNAGPGRPVQWRSKLGGTVEGAVFAETIPFTETRLYVKHVLSNAVYYSMLFTGQPQSLKQRLGTVSPQAARQVALP
ncbi:MAG TPA: transglycosylase SLT domain-containing protein [Pusillimonas sp.]|uniref:lytic transglycosylase domain-containing protein n=1 Tax=Pusillimonas sp. TaxID=3040095 RepID=UPI002BFD3192|nr:transglycosylase SLT domain-containing protein [Pusillimonas sp.]HUH88256.1 transglycosylase SLT domain-containing protein [Pusillimonas sp.]